MDGLGTGYLPIMCVEHYRYHNPLDRSKYENKYNSRQRLENRSDIQILRFISLLKLPIASDNTGLFKMIVKVLTTFHKQYT